MDCKHKPRTKVNSKPICIKCGGEIQITQTWCRIMKVIEVFTLSIIVFAYTFFSEIVLGKFETTLLLTILFFSIPSSIFLLNYLVENIAQYEEVYNIKMEGMKCSHKPRFEDKYNFSYPRCKNCGRKVRMTRFWNIICALPYLILILIITIICFFVELSPFSKAILAVIVIDIAWGINHYLISKAKYKEV